MFYYKGRYRFTFQSYVANKKGITLIELLLALALISMILSISYSLNIFGIKSFSKASSQANVQENVRLAVDFITQETRYATQLEILDNLETIPEKAQIDEDEYYILLNDHSIEYRYKDHSKVIANIIENLSFHKDKDADKILSFIIEGKDKKQKYDLNSKVLAINLTKEIMTSSENGIAIKYKKTKEKENKTDYEKWKNCVLSTNFLAVGKNTMIKKINTPNPIIYVNGDIYLDKNSQISLPKNAIIYAKGDIFLGQNAQIRMEENSTIYTDGNIYIGKNAWIYSKENTTIYAKGSIELEQNSLIKLKENSRIFSCNRIYLEKNATIYLYRNSMIYAKGNIHKEKNALVYGKEVNFNLPNISISDLSIPPLQKDEWYIEKKYSSIMIARNNMKFFGSYFELPKNRQCYNITIVSKGMIGISKNCKASGVLYAPDDIVIINKNSFFDGIVIANEIYLDKNVQLSQVLDYSNDLPF
ncbi:prepilin-type N-terminal cleavage/methylation domain-containing protein [Crassaminicella thermophila]|uniref:prepilin-type N-terminal cleavage/methylation domain-containing protein n=1 Tax=Crassaminicella thermophila TaxID=2599308 RepID=UPI00143D9EC1|nr:prepilin-type N-terminal cleavage/methylation domain-containing protein [Crassaminicella thermophila]